MFWRGKEVVEECLFVVLRDAGRGGFIFHSDFRSVVERLTFTELYSDGG